MKGHRTMFKELTELYKLAKDIEESKEYLKDDEKELRHERMRLKRLESEYCQKSLETLKKLKK
jgi:predicted anti-sigma-YlaC factor YlaD